MYKITLSLLLTFVTLLTFAQPAKISDQYDTMWELQDGGKTLVISGEGYCPGFKLMTERPWDAYRKEITTIVVEDGVLGMGYNAFQLHTNLTKVTLPSSLEFISSKNFSYCYELKQIVLPENIKNVYHHGFENCFNLTAVRLPRNITQLKIGDKAFGNYRKLKGFISQQNWQVCSIEGNDVVFTEDSGMRGAYNTNGRVLIAPDEYTDIFFQFNKQFREATKDR